MTAAALAALVCAAAGPVTCAVAMTVIAGATGAVFGLLTACVANQDRWWHVTLPDIQHSWCSK
jgi:membrane associated rhomboid family serine protease